MIDFFSEGRAAIDGRLSEVTDGLRLPMLDERAEDGVVRGLKYEPDVEGLLPILAERAGEGEGELLRESLADEPEPEDDGLL